MFKPLLISIAIGAATLGPYAQAEQGTGDIRAAVNTVVDGDTIVIEQSGIPVTVDLEGIDAPELEQPYGKEAKAYLESLIQGKKVLIHQQRTFDYSHISGVVTINGLDVNAKMVADGFAWADENYTYSSRLTETQKNAKKAKKGLWVQKNPQQPEAFLAGPQKKIAPPIIEMSYPETASDSAPVDPKGPPSSVNPHVVTPPTPKAPPPPGAKGNYLNQAKIQQAKTAHDELKGKK